MAVASRTAPLASVCEAVIVELPLTGVSPTMTSKVPSDLTATPPAATDPSTLTVTAEHGTEQKPLPCTVTRSPGTGWEGVTWICADAPSAAGDPSRATSAIVPNTVFRSPRDIVWTPLRSKKGITSP